MSERDKFTKEPSDADDEGLYHVHIYLFKHHPYTAGNVYNKRIRGTRSEVDATVSQLRSYYVDTMGYPPRKVQIKVEKVK
jgi:hypothetical protein